MSSDSPTSTRLGLRELAWFLGLGAVAVIGHAATRDQGDFAPGHQGLVWIALLLVGRTTSRTRWAGTTVALGAAAVSMLPVWGFGDPYRGLEYMVVGTTLDLGYWLLSRWQDRIWLLVPLGGIAFMLKPLLRVEISVLTGWPYGSILWGVAYPTATHFVFGAIGAAIGAVAVLGVRRYRSGAKN